MKTNKLLIIITLLVAFIFTGCAYNDILSQEEITELRNEYPLSEIDFGNLSIDITIFDSLDSFEVAKYENFPVIIGTVINSGLTEEINLITDVSSNDYKIKEKILEDKGFNIGIMEFQIFEIIVEEDPILPYGNIKKGDIVTVKYINRLSKNNPFIDGTKGIFILIPHASENLLTSYDVFTQSFFYITDEEYVLGNIMTTANEKYTGKKLNKVITLIKEAEAFKIN